METTYFFNFEYDIHTQSIQEVITFMKKCDIKTLELSIFNVKNLPASTQGSIIIILF